MRNRLLVPNFLFIFYSVMGSTGTTPSAHSKTGTLADNRPVAVFASLVARVTKEFQLKSVFFVSKAYKRWKFHKNRLDTFWEKWRRKSQKIHIRRKNSCFLENRK